jgi:putative transposase
VIDGQRDVLGVKPSCEALGLPRATYYRARIPSASVSRPRSSPRALSKEEKETVVVVLNEERFMDLPPAQVHSQLLDEKRYLCSIRTMYRVLDENKQVRERRDQRRHPVYQAPELLATRPNELWSWDISKLKGPVKWTWFYLYVILDVFSRYVVGWMLAHRESAALAERLIKETCERQGIVPGRLTVHADRGSSMTSKTVAMLLSDLGVTKTHSRPHVSNDNPFSESHFKTLKYRPDFPKRFGSIQDGRGFCRDFFPWYNTVHRHSALGWFTPHDVHYGHVDSTLSKREEVLHEAYKRNPERFVRGIPKPKKPPTEVWINKPREEIPSSEEIELKLQQHVSQTC